LDSTQNPWTEETRELWQRIEAHPLQKPQSLDFHKRLCREQRWTPAYGAQVILEYKRFAFLSCITTLSLTPSVDVDEAWHLHLTYTEDYWTIFCPEVLRRPLHHRPTTGSAADGRRFREQYAATLQFYHSYFGPPDPKIWPGSQERFHQPGRFQRVNTQMYWVLRKPWKGHR
jgi:hypothetical protein